MRHFNSCILVFRRRLGYLVLGVVRSRKSFLVTLLAIYREQVMEVVFQVIAFTSGAPQ